jgi:Arc/MetJ-type ribon-helix-helix transcriptional regulator
MVSERISVRLDKRLHQRLAEEAAAKEKSESEVVREALEAHLKRNARPMSCLELARQYNLLGVVKGLPADLSTNRDHIEALGR